MRNRFDDILDRVLDTCGASLTLLVVILLLPAALAEDVVLWALGRDREG